MSGLDIGVLLLSILGAFVGLQIGAVSALFDIAAGFAGSWTAARFYPSLAHFFPNPSLAYFAVFAVTAGAIAAGGIAASQALERFFLGLIDKFLGAVFGIGLSLVFVSIVLVPMLLGQSPAVTAMVRRSAFAPYLVRATQKNFRLTPQDLWERVEPMLESEQVRRVRRLLEMSR
jgi:uncharacterized membrane protein required for colicin V production